MNYFSSTFGLVTKNDPTTENGGLFFAHYLVLKTMLKELPVQMDDVIFENKMNAAQVDPGLYLRSSFHKTRTVSQDEQTGFAVAAYLRGDYRGREIWNYMVDHFGNYPATGTFKTYNPGSFYSWAVLAGSKISFMFAPLYTINMLISSNKAPSNTSSKLMYLTELFCTRNESLYCLVLYKYFIWRMGKMYGDKWVQSLYDIYFSTEDLDHPLRALSRRIDSGVFK